MCKNTVYSIAHEMSTETLKGTTDPSLKAPDLRIKFKRSDLANKNSLCWWCVLEAPGHLKPHRFLSPLQTSRNTILEVETRTFNKHPHTGGPWEPPAHKGLPVLCLPLCPPALAVGNSFPDPPQWPHSPTVRT